MALILHIIAYFITQMTMHFFYNRNLQISGPSLYNPEMSQLSSDLPILYYFFYDNILENYLFVHEI